MQWRLFTSYFSDVVTSCFAREIPISCDTSEAPTPLSVQLLPPSLLELGNELEIDTDVTISETVTGT